MINVYKKCIDFFIPYDCKRHLGRNKMAVVYMLVMSNICIFNESDIGEIQNVVSNC